MFVFFLSIFGDFFQLSYSGTPAGQDHRPHFTAISLLSLSSFFNGVESKLIGCLLAFMMKCRDDLDIVWPCFCGLLSFFDQMRSLAQLLQLACSTSRFTSYCSQALALALAQLSSRLESTLLYVYSYLSQIDRIMWYMQRAIPGYLDLIPSIRLDIQVMAMILFHCSPFKNQKSKAKTKTKTKWAAN